MDLCSVNDIKGLLSRHGFRFSKALGQNFLTAAWVPERIAGECGADRACGVLEIGPGVGCLTRELSLVAGKVVAVELDKRLPDLLAESLAGCTNVEIISGDILVLDLPALVREKFSGLTPMVCANLPYNITSPVLSALIDSRSFETITVMVQREVARRIASTAQHGDYGSFSVYVNYHAEPEILFDVSPDCFMPQPKVWSSVIRLKMRKTPPAEVTDEAFFFRVVRAAFAQRRKTLVNALTASFGTLSKSDITDIVVSCGFSPMVRGEELDIPGFASLATVIKQRM